MTRLRLSSLLPKGRALIWTIVALVLIPVALLLFASLFRIHVTLDLAAVLEAFALGLLAVTVFHLVRHWLKPKETVAIGYRVKLEQPMMPVVGRYSFRLEVFYEVEHKGERARVDQGTIELRFRKADHPDMLAWCCEKIGEHLGKHVGHAHECYPDARVVLPPEPTPALLERQVGAVEPEQPG